MSRLVLCLLDCVSDVGYSDTGDGYDEYQAGVCRRQAGDPTESDPG